MIRESAKEYLARRAKREAQAESNVLTMQGHPVYAKRPLTAREVKRRQGVLEALEKAGGNISMACRGVRISRKTFYNWLKDERPMRRPWNEKIEAEPFPDLVHEVIEGIKDNVESALYKAGIEGNVTAQIFYLKTQCKDRGYTEKQTHEHNLDMKGKVVLDVDYQPTEDSLFYILKAEYDRRKEQGLITPSRKKRAN